MTIETLTRISVEELFGEASEDFEIDAAFELDSDHDADDLPAPPVRSTWDEVLAEAALVF